MKIKIPKAKIIKSMNYILISIWAIGKIFVAAFLAAYGFLLVVTSI